jgi:hypothetical protein
MTPVIFKDDERGYREWLAGNEDGFVLNIQRGLHPGDARVHRATCGTIAGTPPRGRAWTETYIKVCGSSLAELNAWADQKSGPVRACRRCQP